jgi:hypothetical protein
VDQKNMSEDKYSKAESIAKSVEKISDSKGLEAIGVGLGMGVSVLAIFMAIPLLMFASKWDGHLHEQKQCYEIQEIKGKAYKVNTCNGDIEEIPPKESDETHNTRPEMVRQ